MICRINRLINIGEIVMVDPNKYGQSSIVVFRKLYGLPDSWLPSFTDIVDEMSLGWPSYICDMVTYRLACTSIARFLHMLDSKGECDEKRIEKK